VIAYHAGSKEEWWTKARRAEHLGYSVLLVPDHLEAQLAPVPALLAAAEATTSLRIGSYVFANDFRHPVLLAQEAATLDVLSEGRFELGIGAGWMRTEYEQAGIPYAPAAIRVSRLEETLHIVKGLFAAEPLTFSGAHYTVNHLTGFPKPVQRPHPPLLVGGASKRLLSIAAHEASIVSLTARILPDESKLDVTDTTPMATRQKIAWVQQAAGARFHQLELNILIFAVMVTQDRLKGAEALAARFKTTAEEVLQNPHCLVGTQEQICEAVQERRALYGISYLSVFEEEMEAFSPVVARLTEK
jgi:probable F420-dependent oxidoreductase